MRILPASDRRYLEARGLLYDEIQDGNQAALVLRDFALPDMKFQVADANVLILLPPGYPDVPPDMFFTHPWLTFRGSTRHPRSADQPLETQGRRWQRWSRHSSHWRPGQDGIRTVVNRIRRAFEVAE